MPPWRKDTQQPHCTENERNDECIMEKEEWEVGFTCNISMKIYEITTRE